MTSLRKHWKYIRNLKIVSVLLCILGIHYFFIGRSKDYTPVHRWCHFCKKEWRWTTGKGWSKV